MTAREIIAGRITIAKLREIEADLLAARETLPRSEGGKAVDVILGIRDLIASMQGVEAPTPVEAAALAASVAQ